MRDLQAPELVGGGIALRAPVEADVGWITEACRDDPEIGRWIPVIPIPYNEEHARGFVAHSATSWANGTEAVFVIGDAATGAPLGMITVHFAQTDPGLAGVGYWLRAEARGRGVATTALRLVSQWTLGELGVERLHLTTLPDNVRSQNVAERAGFLREGLLRRWAPTREGRRDSVIFSLLREDLP